MVGRLRDDIGAFATIIPKKNVSGVSDDITVSSQSSCYEYKYNQNNIIHIVNPQLATRNPHLATNLKASDKSTPDSCSPVDFYTNPGKVRRRFRPSLRICCKPV